MPFDLTLHAKPGKEVKKPTKTQLNGIIIMGGVGMHLGYLHICLSYLKYVIVSIFSHFLVLTYLKIRFNVFVSDESNLMYIDVFDSCSIKYGCTVWVSANVIGRLLLIILFSVLNYTFFIFFIKTQT